MMCYCRECSETHSLPYEGSKVEAAGGCDICGEVRGLYAGYGVRRCPECENIYWGKYCPCKEAEQ